MRLVRMSAQIGRSVLLEYGLTVLCALHGPGGLAISFDVVLKA
jgi:hypothetical protein